MKILQTPVRLFSPGGVESYVANLSTQLSMLGHEVKVICADTPGQRVLGDKVEVKPLWSAGKIANTNITPSLPWALFGEKFDLIHAHMPTPWSADWSAAASRFRRKPLVLTYHSDIVGRGTASYLARAYNRSGLKFVLDSADKILVARSSHLSSCLEDHKDKVSVVPIGVDEKAFVPFSAPQRCDVFFLSVLDEFHGFKGLEVLLRSLKTVKEEFEDVRLVVGGSGARLEAYRSLARSLGLEKNVGFAGFIPEGDLAGYYNGCRLFVLPSTNPSLETFGIVLVEAMACARPVVATEIAGAADDVRRANAGIVVRSDDDVGLARAIVRILKDERMAEEMGMSGRRLVEEKYSWKKVALQIEMIYQDLAQD